MSNIYGRTSDGSEADSGATWLLAKATLSGMAAIDAAGDSLFMDSAFAEVVSGAVNIAIAGTLASPNRVMSVSDAAEPPTTPTAGATISSTAAATYTIYGSAYFYGITWDLGASNAVNTILNLNALNTTNNRQLYESCTFRIMGNGSGSILNINASGSSNSDPNWTRWVNCNVKFARSSITITNWSDFIWEGGGIESGSTALSLLFGAPGSGRPANYDIRGVDLSAMGSACNIFNAAGQAYQKGTLRNCKLPASWTGSLTTGTFKAQGRFAMYNCDNADTNYRLWIEEYAGTIRDETTLVRSGGASDGTTPLAWKLTTDENANEAVSPLVTDPIPVWIDITGASKTVEVDFVHDGATNLQNDEVWMEVEYLGTSGYPLSSKATCKRASVLTSPADHASSSASWTTTGLSAPNKQKLSVNFTPQEKGVALIRIFLGKPSQTIYVDPKPTVS